MISHEIYTHVCELSHGLYARQIETNESPSARAFKQITPYVLAFGIYKAATMTSYKAICARTTTHGFIEALQFR